MSPVFSAFGLALRFHAPLPGTGATTGRLDATVRLAVGEPGELSAVWTGASGPPHWETDLTDGSRVSLVPGRGGDWLLQTPTAAFCFSADLRTSLSALLGVYFSPHPSARVAICSECASSSALSARSRRALSNQGS